MTSIENKSNGADAAKGRGAVQRRRISRRRLWLFRVTAALIVPLLLLLMAELCLRVAGFGYPAGAFIECESSGRESYCNNIKFGWRFIPRRVAPEFGPFVFPAQKAPGTCRVFVLGASAAHGDPEPAYGFARVLDVLLQERYPGVRFEVVDASTAAINSHVILQVARDCARQHPDLFVLYLGNNEVVGPYGAGTIFSPVSSSMPAIRASIWAKSFRIGQLFEGVAASIGGGETGSSGSVRLEMFLENQVRAGSPELEQTYRHFERNLRDICDVGLEGGAKVVLCSVGSNLKDCAPFASMHRPDLTSEQQMEWERLYREGDGHQAAGKYADAEKSYLAASKIDESFAELQFRLGECYGAMGDCARAKEKYVEARDLDTLRFRADTRINQIIRSVGQAKNSQGVYFVDIVEALEKDAPEAIPGEELFWEHVHFRFNGNYLLARTILQQIDAALPEHVRAKKAKDSPLLTQQECAARLAYTGWNHYIIARRVLDRYVKGPPFSNRLRNEHNVELLEDEIEAFNIDSQPDQLQATVEVFEKAVERSPEDWFLRTMYADLLLNGLKDPGAAEEHARFFARILPYSPWSYESLASMLHQQGKYDDAIEVVREGLGMGLETEWLYWQMAMAYGAKGHRSKAIRHHRKALEVNPAFVQGYYNLAEELSRQGKADKAIKVLRRGIQVDPQQVVLHVSLGSLLGRQGNIREAIEEADAALKIDPGYGPALQLLKQLEGMAGRK